MFIELIFHLLSFKFSYFGCWN